MDTVPSGSPVAMLQEDLARVKVFCDEDPDFDLRSEDGSVRMHRAVLAAALRRIRMLSGTCREATEGHVDVPPVPGTSKVTLQNLKYHSSSRHGGCGRSIGTDGADRPPPPPACTGRPPPPPPPPAGYQRWSCCQPVTKHARDPFHLNSGLEPAPVGNYPEELLAAAPGGLPSWDDVRVRYDYYKKRGYLRDLTLSDYVKWEEWWYKYQEWLKRKTAYERWENSAEWLKRETAYERWENSAVRRHRRSRRKRPRTYVRKKAKANPQLPEG